MAGYDWQAIKAQVDIADIIGSYVTVRRAGNISEACCPFHGEKTPSLKIYDDHAHCYGCGWHGDAVDFVMEADKCDMATALARIGADSLGPSDPRGMATMKAEREAEQKIKRIAAKKAALGRWNTARMAGDNHPYLVRKGIPALGARVEGDNLLLPIYGPNGGLQSVQTISPDGTKMFATGAPVKLGRFNLGVNFGRAILCEGFATGVSIFEAMADQVRVGYSCGNVVELAREAIANGENFVIAADHKGRDKIDALCAETGCIAVFPPEPHDDFNDLHKAEGLDAVALAITKGIREHKRPPAAPKDSDPIDLWDRSAPPPFPEGLLPDVIERFALARARQMGVDPGGIAMAAITACGAVITDRIKVKVKRHERWTESARLWCMLVGNPSFKKSPIMRAAAGVIASMDADMLRDYHQKMRRWEDMGQQGDPPQQERLRIEDTTIEAAQEVCKASPNGILALQDELSGWFGGIEKYAGGKGGAKDRAFWLSAYNGGQYAVNRISRKSVLIENLSISILGGVQPDAIARIVGDSVDDGLIQRFIPIVLQPAEVGVDEEMPDVAQEYDALIERLHGLTPAQSIVGDMPLEFDNEARLLREELERRHHAMVSSIEHVNRKLASHLGKYDGLFPRLCVIWHCIENACAKELPPVISGATARRVEAFLSKYIMRHSMAFYVGILGLSDRQDILADVAGYILAHDELESVTLRIFMRGSTAMKKIPHEDRAGILDELETLGWLEKTARRGSDTWTVRPGVREFFADKAKMERERREAVREILNNMMAEPKARS